jgi:hypothetical protein
MKRTLITVTVALAFALGLSSTASADASVDLVWLSSSNTAAKTGTSSIQAADGDLLTLSIFITAGTEGLSSYGISISFDAPGSNRLNLQPFPANPMDTAAATEFGLAPTITCQPFPSCFFDTPTMANITSGVSSVIESDFSNTGFVYTFEAGTLGNGLLASFGAFELGQIDFKFQNPEQNSATLKSGFFNFGADGAYSNTGTEVAVSFGAAAIDAFAPEPGAAALLGMGLCGLVLAGRRNRS